jgi:hypothetical protein
MSEHAKPGRNEPCYCGSGKKYKRCCYNGDIWKKAESGFIEAAVGRTELTPFDRYFPAIAEKETRCIWALGRQPPEQPFMLREYFCDDVSCHCNRVMLLVIDLAAAAECAVSVSYAFDRSDPDPGPYIDPTNPCSIDGRQLFPIIKQLLDSDTDYVERLKRHYRMVKQKVATDNPDGAKLIRDPRMLYKPKPSHGALTY